MAEPLQDQLSEVYDDIRSALIVALKSVPKANALMDTMLVLFTEIEARLDALEAVPVSGNIVYDDIAETATLNFTGANGNPARNVYIPMALIEESLLDLVPTPPAFEPGLVAEIDVVNSWVYPVTDINGQIVISAKKNTVKAASRVTANIGGIVLIDDFSITP